MARTSKVVTLAEAASMVPDGTRLALGGLSIYQHPMAIARELVRQGRRGLTIVGVLNGPELDILAGAGCVRKVETSYVGMERFGLAPNYRRAAEAGRLEVEYYSEMLAFDRFRASEDGLTFAVSKALAGTDLARAPGPAVPFQCPITGGQYIAVSAAEPDIAVIHVPYADQFGNALCPHRRLLPQSFDAIVARSTSTLIVTAEHLVDNATVRRHPYLTFIPGFRVKAVVAAPYGAHPCHSLSAYTADVGHFEEYMNASRSDQDFSRYLEHYVSGPSTEDGYLSLMGTQRLLALRTGELI